MWGRGYETIPGHHVLALAPHSGLGIRKGEKSRAYFRRDTVLSTTPALLACTTTLQRRHYYHHPHITGEALERTSVNFRGHSASKPRSELQLLPRAGSVVVICWNTPDTFLTKYYMFIKQFRRSWNWNLRECVCETDSKHCWVFTRLCQEKRWLTFSEHLLCARHFPECFTRINLTHTLHAGGTIILTLQLRKVLQFQSLAQCNHV